MRSLGVIFALTLLCACTAARPSEAAVSPTTLSNQDVASTLAPTASVESTELPTAIPSPTLLPKPTVIPTATPEPAWPNGFQVGVHADDIIGHLATIQDTGIEWVAAQAWHFGGDAVAMGDTIDEAHDSGMLAFVSVTGDWLRGYEKEYQAEFVAALARLAADGADAIEVWDQPNSLASMPVIDPALYTELLCAAYAAIKGANPATLVISAPPAPSAASQECSAEQCGDAQWLEALATQGAFECADLIGARYTVGASSPGSSTAHPSGLDHHSFYFRPLIRRYFEAAGGETPLAFSQFGYLSAEGYGSLPDAFWWAGATTVAQQAAWVVEAVEIAAQSPMVGMLMIWHLDAADWGGDYESVRAGYALIRPDGSCLACQMLRQAYREP